MDSNENIPRKLSPATEQVNLTQGTHVSTYSTHAHNNGMAKKLDISEDLTEEPIDDEYMATGRILFQLSEDVDFPVITDKGEAKHIDSFTSECLCEAPITDEYMAGDETDNGCGATSDDDYRNDEKQIFRLSEANVTVIRPFISRCETDEMEETARCIDDESNAPILMEVNERDNHNILVISDEEKPNKCIAILLCNLPYGFCLLLLVLLILVLGVLAWAAFRAVQEAMSQ